MGTYFYDWARVVLLETSLAAQTEREPALAERGVVGLGEVVAVPDDDFGIHGRVDVVVHPQELVVVLVLFLVGVVVFERDSQGVLLVDVEARLDGVHHLVVGHQLRLGFVFLVGDGVEEGACQVEDGVVHAGFEQEGVRSLALVGVEAPDRVDAVVELGEALGVVHFGTEHVGVATVDFGAEYPVEARGDNQVLVGVVDERETVSGKEGDGVVGGIGGAQVKGAASVLVVTDIEAYAAEFLFADNDRVAGNVAPEVVVECACAVGHVTEDERDFVAYVPAELDAVEIERVVAAL